MRNNLALRTVAHVLFIVALALAVGIFCPAFAEEEPLADEVTVVQEVSEADAVAAVEDAIGASEGESVAAANTSEAPEVTVEERETPVEIVEPAENDGSSTHEGLPASEEQEVAGEESAMQFEGGKNAGAAQSISVNSWVYDRMTDANSYSPSMERGYLTWYKFTINRAGWICPEFTSDYVNYNRGWTYEVYRQSDLNNSLVRYHNNAAFYPNVLVMQRGYKLGLPAGTYYLALRTHWLGWSTLKNVNYRFRIAYTQSDVWEKEPNESAGTANAISTNTVYYGSNSRDAMTWQDWYQFTLKEKTDMTFQFGRESGQDFSSGKWEVRIQRRDQVGSNTYVLNERIRDKDLLNDKKLQTVSLDAGTYYIYIGKREDASTTLTGLNYHFKLITPPGGSTAVYRLYNRKTSEHLYTINYGEFRDLPQITKGDWVQEGIAWYAPKSSKTPVYRLYNKKSGDHHYTTSKAEADTLVARHGWTLETTAFYSDDAKRVPLYRLYNGRLQRGQHHYTADANERDVLSSKHGWKYETIGFYGVSAK